MNESKSILTLVWVLVAVVLVAVLGVAAHEGAAVAWWVWLSALSFLVTGLARFWGEAAASFHRPR